MSEILENSAGKELIEATQEAVIDAVSDVGNIIKTTTEGIANGGHEPFYQSPEFWVGMAFVTVVVVLYVPLRKVFAKLLQGKVDSVVAQIKDAEQLRDEAREILAEYEQKVEGLKSKTMRIVRKAKNDTEAFKTAELKKIDEELAAQKKQIEAIIKSNEEKMVAESSKVIVERATVVLQSAISSGLSTKSKKSLIDKSIQAISELK